MARVLVVDSDDESRQAILAALQTVPHGTVHPWAHRVSTAATKAAALELLDTLNFELILVSVDIAREADWDLVRYIRARHELLDVPVLVTAAYRSSVVEFEAVAAGVDRWVTKPFADEELRALLAVMCEDR